LKTLSFLIFSFIIYFQPTGFPQYISEKGVTRFQNSENIGLLSHNTDEAGTAFSLLEIGDYIYVDELPYVVYKVYRYEVKNNLFISKLNTSTELEVFNLVYRKNSDLTLQTCIEKDGNFQWGRLFILANREDVNP